MKKYERRVNGKMLEWKRGGGGGEEGKGGKGIGRERGMGWGKRVRGKEEVVGEGGWRKVAAVVEEGGVAAA